MEYKVLHKDKRSGARTGIITTDHGTIETPVFMPVGTLGTVKGVHQRELKEDTGAQIILGNSYHLYLRPGTDIIKEAGGIHKFTGWDRPVLTDSGGYQLFSLAENRKITGHGVVFRSHIDGSEHSFTAENIIDIQRTIGADIIMGFDECTPYPCDRGYAEKSLDITHDWLARSINRFKDTEPLYGYEQTIFPIVQGSVYNDLRQKSAEYVTSLNAEGNAIGGLSVGEPAEEMYSMLEIVNKILPLEKPRYLMGVGTPANILEAVALGVDMFDCVIPTRNGRNGMLFTNNGIINIKNEKWKNDFSPVDPDGISFVDRHYSKAYLRHLIMANELLGAQIASIHNLGFYMSLMNNIRQHIKSGDFRLWKDKAVKQFSERL